MRTLPSILAISAVLLPLGLSGCASHLISSARPDGTCAAGQPCSVSQTSVGGRAGISSDGVSGHVTNKECGDEGMTRVEVRRNFGQGLVTFLTLGMVSPATIYFYCAKPPAPPEPASPADQNPDEF